MSTFPNGNVHVNSSVPELVFRELRALGPALLSTPEGVVIREFYRSAPGVHSVSFSFCHNKVIVVSISFDT